MPAGSATRDWLGVLLSPALTDRQRLALVAAAPDASWHQRAQSAIAQPIRSDLLRVLDDAGRDPRVTATLDWLSADNHHLMTLDDPDYPALLREIPGPPPALYLKGRRKLLEQPALAIVGSRNPSALGIQTAELFAQSFAHAGLTVTSGLALGIDAAAHRGALGEPGSTVAVVGTGLDIVYPAKNRALAHQIAAEGTLVSEFPLGMPARSDHFPRRNRILSGLSLGCLVVEANLRSGSLITARLAAEQGREVFAVPGSIHSPLSKGCHALIRQGAKLTECAADVIAELGWTSTTQSSGTAGTADPERSRGDRLAPEPLALLAAVTYDPISADTLAERLGWPAQRVASALLELELAERVAPAGHGAWQRLADPHPSAA